MLSRILALSAVAFGLAVAVAAPVKFDFQTASFVTQAAEARRGADDRPGDDRGGRGRHSRSSNHKGGHR